jgi:hypothetical protein
MDFTAWFEAYLGGAWHTFDARNNMPHIGRVLIARGRDAADVAITTAFGPNTLSSFTGSHCAPLSRLRWMIPSTRIHDLACIAWPATAAARAFPRATVAASLP